MDPLSTGRAGDHYKEEQVEGKKAHKKGNKPQSASAINQQSKTKSVAEQRMSQAQQREERHDRYAERKHGIKRERPEDRDYDNDMNKACKKFNTTNEWELDSFKREVEGLLKSNEQEHIEAILSITPESFTIVEKKLQAIPDRPTRNRLSSEWQQLKARHQELRNKP